VALNESALILSQTQTKLQMKSMLFKIVLMPFILLSMASSATNIINCTQQKDGVPLEIKELASYTGFDRSSSISASIDGHTLTIVFTENLGQVSIEVSYASGNDVETTSIYTPSGVIIYIPYSGSYIVTFTLPNGDEYYGEFDVTE